MTDRPARPLIGITAGRYADKAGRVYTRLPESYALAVAAAGGSPILIPAIDDAGAPDQILGLLDGILFPGGIDVVPERYGETAHLTVVADPVLDALSVEELRDQMTVRIAAAECLFALAFYAAWLESPRHMAWLEDHGRTYYLHTSHLSKTDNDKKTFWLMSTNFASWVKACQEMQADLRDRPFLLPSDN